MGKAKETFEEVRNRFGIKVCKKCLSCVYYDGDYATYGLYSSNGVDRVNSKPVMKEGVCAKVSLRVKGSGRGCGFWEMREQLQNVGDVEGSIHTPEWIEFVSEHAREFMQGGDAFLREMIRQYESVHGSRYLKMSGQP